MKIKQLFSSHGNAKQDPKEPEVFHIFWGGTGRVKDETVYVEATLVLGIWS